MGGMDIEIPDWNLLNAWFFMDSAGEIKQDLVSGLTSHEDIALAKTSKIAKVQLHELDKLSPVFLEILRFLEKEKKPWPFYEQMFAVFECGEGSIIFLTNPRKNDSA